MSLHAILLVWLSWNAMSEPQPAQRLLFIGNSYTYSNNLPELVAEFYQAVKQPKPVIESIVMGGASLGDHWANPGTQQRITQGKWNYIIMQQGPSSLAASQKEFMADMERAKPWLKQSGAKPALFMVWPDTTRRKFFPQVRQGYANAAKAVDGLFMPAGLAFQNLLEKEPGLILYSQDGLHPTPAGTYVAALVIAAKLTGESPSQFPAGIKWSQGIEVNLTPAQHQRVVQAAILALKDEGK